MANSPTRPRPPGAARPPPSLGSAERAAGAAPSASSPPAPASPASHGAMRSPAGAKERKKDLRPSPGVREGGTQSMRTTEPAGVLGAVPGMSLAMGACSASPRRCLGWASRLRASARCVADSCGTAQPDAAGATAPALAATGVARPSAGVTPGPVLPGVCAPAARLPGATRLAAVRSRSKAPTPRFEPGTASLPAASLISSRAAAECVAAARPAVLDDSLGREGASCSCEDAAPRRSITSTSMAIAAAGVACAGVLSGCDGGGGVAGCARFRTRAAPCPVSNWDEAWAS